MKRNVLAVNKSNKSNRPGYGQRMMRIPVAFAILLALFSQQYIADSPAACATPKDEPNTSCGSAGGECFKVVVSPPPQSCTGPNVNNLVCFTYSVTGIGTWYTHPGTNCSCDSNGWVPFGNPTTTTVVQAYNNDTSCGG